MLAKVQGADFTIVSVTGKKGREAPPRLFDLTSLQVECNRKFSFSADETLKLVQSLYEKKAVTYPRVDTTYLSDDIYPKVPSILAGLRGYDAPCGSPEREQTAQEQEGFRQLQGNGPSCHNPDRGRFLKHDG